MTKKPRFTKPAAKSNRVKSRDDDDEDYGDDDDDNSSGASDYDSDQEKVYNTETVIYRSKRVKGPRGKSSEPTTKHQSNDTLIPAPVASMSRVSYRATQLRVDSGSDLTVCPSIHHLMNVTATYQDGSQCVEVANGQLEPVIARGDITSEITNALVVPGFEEALLATRPLQKSGHWIIFPSVDAGLNRGVYIVKHRDGKILLTGDEQYIVDSTEDTSAYAAVNLPQINDPTSNGIIARAVVKGIHSKSLDEVVHLLHISLGHMPAESMCW